MRAYIETSVWSHYYAGDAPERRRSTREFLRRCRSPEGGVAIHVSGFVIDELRAATAVLAPKLLRLVQRHKATFIAPSEDVTKLARAYAQYGALPESKLADRLHAAIATVSEMDVLVSWNYRHLVNMTRRAKINSANVQMGYAKPLEIVTPPEVFDDEIQPQTT